ncbi:nicotinamide riboside transporter PnuC [Sphingomonas sp.]|uniref:nicotinamide riboside transporter PnuC n=1 Tax=Sphingomonas sp. TaxID=28214 RepID=UPI0035C83EE2
MASIEWIATVLGLACVALAARRSVWTFPAGIASVALLGMVVFQARLYSDALLQAFFVAANIYGWRNWSRSNAATGTVRVTRMDASERLRWTAVTLAASLGWAAFVHRFTDASYPLWDALIAGTSVAAQLLMARRRIEHWWLWIAVDLASVPLYLAKGLHLFAALYLLYLALSVWGLIDWRRAERGSARGVATA